ncbi:hypothetical protein WN943_010484 [Citrus x changshan-huyou]
MKINQKLEVHDGQTVVVPPAIKITYEFALTMVNEAVSDPENPKWTEPSGKPISHCNMEIESRRMVTS